MRDYNDRYDIIGDIHGYADVLEKLLRKLGYEKPREIWQHPEGRKALFLGDFIDRGPSIPRALKIVKAMVDAGEALAVMGNHEYNALLFHTRGENGDWLRPRTPKNVNQHAATLAQFWNDRDAWEDYLEWFASLPLWVDLGGLRAVHASWDDRLITANPRWRFLDEQLLRRSRIRGSAEFEHCEVLLKGTEADLPKGCFIADKEQTVRTRMRLRWWLPARGRTYFELCMPLPTDSDNVPREAVPESFEALCPGYPADAPPLFFGHYWLPFEGGAKLIAPNVACLDFSVAKGGALFAYRWDGERTLDTGKMVFAREEEE